MSGEQLFPIAPARRRAMYFNLACYGLVAVFAGGYWNGGFGWYWAIFALGGFALFALTLRTLTQRSVVARITGTEIQTQGPFGQAYVFDAADMVGANLDASRRIGVIAYRDKASGAESYAPVSFRMMGPEAAQDFVARITALRPGLPAIKTSGTQN